jgi:predicted DNA-binding protein (MmcQ/YjbR family)
MSKPARPKTTTKTDTKTDTKMTRAESALRAVALGYPETIEEFPWGERVIKVRGKVFLFLGHGHGPGQGTCALSLSVKLPETGTMALLLPFVEPTGYGLGKSGWITAQFPSAAEVPVDLIADWIDERYRAVAPKSLVAQLPGRRAAAPKPAPRRPRTRRRS